MKKILMLVLVAFFALGSGFAQTAESTGKKGNDGIEALTTALNLSKEQVSKVNPIVKESQVKQKELTAKMKAGGDKAALRAEKTRLTAETDKKLKAVLTPEQAVKLDAYRKQAKEASKKKK